MTSPISIKLNGQWITGRIDGTDSFNVQMTLNSETNQPGQSFSSELTFYDDGYSILKTALIDDPNGFNNTVPIEIFDTCCNDAVFVGVIKGDAIDWCEPKCFISANVIQETPAFNCIQSTLIWDNWNGFLDQPRAAMRYCIEMSNIFIQIIVAYLAYLVFFIVEVILYPFLLAAIVIFALVYFVCTIVCAISTDCSQSDCNNNYSPGTVINIYRDILNTLNSFLIPCGRFHPSALIRDYIINVCAKCGLNFQSSILNDPASPYWNAVLMAGQVNRGRKKGDGNFTLISENLPIETLETLLNNILKPVFNAEWRLYGNTLIFERKDYFQTTTQWIDAVALLGQKRILNSEICFSWIDRDRPAFADFQYIPDAIDSAGSEAIRRWSDIVEWNIPFNPAQKGKKEVILNLTPVRTREDRVGRFLFDNFGYFNFYEFMENALSGAINAIVGGAYSQYTRAILLSQHTFLNYKLVIWNGNIENGEVINIYPDSFTGGMVSDSNGNIPFVNRTNYPFWFVEGRTNNLYSLFHYIDDPRLPQSTQFNFNFEFEFECSDLSSFDWSKTISLLKNGNIVSGRPTEITINFNNRTISVQGII